MDRDPEGAEASCVRLSTGWVAPGPAGLLVALGVLSFGAWVTSLSRGAAVVPWVLVGVGVLLLLRWVRGHARYELVLRRDEMTLAVERTRRFWGHTARRVRMELVAEQIEAEPRSRFDLRSVAEIGWRSLRPDSAWSRYAVVVRLDDGDEYDAIPVSLPKRHALEIAADWNDALCGSR